MIVSICVFFSPAQFQTLFHGSKIKTQGLMKRGAPVLAQTQALQGNINGDISWGYNGIGRDQLTVDKSHRYYLLHEFLDTSSVFCVSDC